MTPFEMVEEFHKTYGVAVNQPFNYDLVILREDLINEELDEVFNETGTAEVINYQEGTFDWVPENIDRKKLTKELADLMYVTIGTAITFGLPLEEVFAEVHKSNMSKLGEDGKPVYREDGKVLKGPNYKEPDLEKFKYPDWREI